MDDRISLNIDAGVADVRMVRAEKMNALDNAMFEALIAAGERLKSEKGLRAVVLSGEGRSFCAGLDMDEFGRLAEGLDSELTGAPGKDKGLAGRTHGIANRAQYAAWIWREVPVPVIAAVHGAAVGSGFQLSLGCDLRYVTPDAKLALMEIRWGLIPDMAGTVLMRGLARDDVVRELTYTGRIFSGEEALAYGLATRVCADPQADALATAHEIASKSPNAIRGSKRLLNRAVFMDAEKGLLEESIEQDRLIGSPNQIEAVMSNLQKRTPAFVDP